MVQYTRARLDASFSALSDVTRRGVLEQLGRADASITELAEKFHMTLTGMKKHVGVLEQAWLVTTKKGDLESKDDLKRRIDEAAQYVPLDQLCLSGQCGFSSTVEGNALTYDEQVAKLRLIVETAAEVWG